MKKDVDVTAKDLSHVEDVLEIRNGTTTAVSADASMKLKLEQHALKDKNSTLVFVNVDAEISLQQVVAQLMLHGMT